MSVMPQRRDPRVWSLPPLPAPQASLPQTGHPGAPPSVELLIVPEWNQIRTEKARAGLQAPDPL